MSTFNRASPHLPPLEGEARRPWWASRELQSKLGQRQPHNRLWRLLTTSYIDAICGGVAFNAGRNVHVRRNNNGYLSFPNTLGYIYAFQGIGASLRYSLQTHLQQQSLWPRVLRLSVLCRNTTYSDDGGLDAPFFCLSVRRKEINLSLISSYRALMMTKSLLELMNRHPHTHKWLQFDFHSCLWTLVHL